MEFGKWQNNCFFKQWIMTCFQLFVISSLCFLENIMKIKTHREEHKGTNKEFGIVYYQDNFLTLLIFLDSKIHYFKFPRISSPLSIKMWINISRKVRFRYSILALFPKLLLVIRCLYCSDTLQLDKGQSDFLKKTNHPSLYCSLFQC